MLGSFWICFWAQNMLKLRKLAYKYATWPPWLSLILQTNGKKY